MGVGGFGRLGGRECCGGDLNVNTFQKESEQKNRNLKILHFFTQKEHLPAQKSEVNSQKTENRPEYTDFDFLLGNPPTCSEY